MNDLRARAGIGMTSARTRERLIARLREQGITDESVLERVRSVPRPLFMDVGVVRILPFGRRELTLPSVAVTNPRS